MIIWEQAGPEDWLVAGSFAEMVLGLECALVN